MSQQTNTPSEPSPDSMTSSTHRWIQGSTLGASVLVVLALLLMVNYLGMRHFQRFDWTGTELYSLSEKTLGVLETLDRDVEASIFMNPVQQSELFRATDELLSRYEAASPRLRKRVIDPVKSPLEARRLIGESRILAGANVIVLSAGEEHWVIDEDELAEYDYSGAQFGEPVKLQAFKGEERITGGLLALMEDEKPRVLWVGGHGEIDIAAPPGPRALSRAKEVLELENFALESWKSLGAEDVPVDAALVVVAGPRAAFLEPELAVFSRYLERGGRMLWLLDPAIDESTGRLIDLGIDTWLASYGALLADDVVIDPAGELQGYDAATFHVDGYGVHPTVDPFRQARLPALVQAARSVRQADPVPGGAEVAQLLHTSPDGWAEMNLDLEGQLKLDPETDLAGPVSLGVAISLPSTGSRLADDGDPYLGENEDESENGGKDHSTQSEARLVVLGDADFATDNLIASPANGALLLNILNWLVHREELITIESPLPQASTMAITESERMTISVIVVFLLPGLAIIAGVLMRIRRRR